MERAFSETSKPKAQWWLNWALNFLKVTRSKCWPHFEFWKVLNATGSRRSTAVSVPFVQTTGTSLMTNFNYGILPKVSIYGSCRFLKGQIKIFYRTTLLVLQVLNIFFFILLQLILSTKVRVNMIRISFFNCCHKWF